MTTPKESTVRHTYTVAAGDTYPLIAEAHGHSGEWQKIAELNPPPADAPPRAWLDPGNLVAGLVIHLPGDWPVIQLMLAVEAEAQSEPTPRSR